MKRLIPLLLLFVGFAACGPNVEDESKAWEQNKQKIDKLKIEFPAYVALFDLKMEQAKKLWDAATAETNEDAKAKKMSEANNLIEQGPIATLRGLKSDLSELDKLSTDLDKQPLDDKALERASEARKKVRKAKDQANEVLNKTGSVSVDEATTLIKKAETRIDEAKSELTSLISQAKQKAADKLKAEQKVSDSLKTDNTKKVETKTPEVKMVKCKFCGNKNKSTEKKCPGCGAAI